MFRILKKVIIVISVMLAVLFLAFFIAAWYYGVFASVEKVHLSDRSRLYLVTTGRTCFLYDIERRINVIDSLLQIEESTNRRALALFYNNPLEVRPDSLLAKGAILLEDSIAVDSPLVLVQLPERKAAVTTIKAHSIIAPFKTYPAIQRWLYNNGYRYNPAFPVIEYYHSRGVIEVEMPVIVDTSLTQLPLKEQ